jgi:branched-chain amino acid transport system permease protein
MKQFLNLLFGGLTLGAIYSLIALGYTMVYGVLRLINFAYAGLFTLGAYAAVWGITVVGLASGRASMTVSVVVAVALLALGLGMLASGAAGVVVERIAYRPLRGAHILAPLISALGVALVLQNLILLVAGSAPKFFPQVLPEGGITVATARLSWVQIAIVGVALALMLALTLVVQRTSLGIQIRATADDVGTARLMGIRVDRTIAAVFALGSALGGAAGVMYVMFYGTATYTMGFVPSVKAFTAAILGGIGSVPGAVVGGFLLGLLESFGAGYLGDLTGGAVGPNYQDVFAFVVLIAILTIRPQGLLGERLGR